MKIKNSKIFFAFLLIIFVLVADQVLKIWIKTNMSLSDPPIYVFGTWFQIHFVENNGMAFGWELGGETGKMILSIFRIIAVIAIGWYLVTLARKDTPLGYVLSISLIFAGAMGNIIDSAFYGMIFSDSMFQPAVMFPEGGGYSSFLHGKVVDMFYFPIIKGTWPEWLGGNSFIFFRPVFNVADSSITIGVFIILLFQRKFFKKH